MVHLRPLICLFLFFTLACHSEASGASDTHSLVQTKLAGEGEKTDLGLVELGAEDDDPNDAESGDVTMIKNELKDMQTKLRRASNAHAGAPPGFPAGGVVGSLEPLVGPLAEQTWRLSESVKRARSGGDIEALSSLDDMLAEVMNEISGFVGDAFHELNKRINEMLARARALATSVAKLKPVADANDETLYACRKQQLNVLGTSTNIKQALIALRDEKTRICALRDNAKYFNWTLRPNLALTAVCDFNELNGEKCQLSTLAANAVNLTEEYKWARQNYFSLKDDCEAAMDSLDKQLAQDELLAVPSKDFAARKADCEIMETKTSVSMCAFGDRLQEKCEAVDSLKETILKLTDRNGSLQSLHYAAQDLECALKGMAMKEAMEGGNNAEIATLTPCEDMSFEAEVGGVNDRSKEIEVLTSGKYFACEDAPVSFFGKRFMNAGQLEGSYELQYTPQFTARPMGAYSFDFCKPSFSLTTTTITVTTTTGTTTLPPNTTTTTMLPGFP